MTDELEVGIKQVLEFPGLSFWSFVPLEWIFTVNSFLLLAYIVYAKTTFRWDDTLHVHGETLLGSGED